MDTHMRVEARSLRRSGPCAPPRIRSPSGARLRLALSDRARRRGCCCCSGGAERPTRETLRRRVLQLAGGASSAAASRGEILQAVQDLVATNPNPDPNSTPEVLDGSWALVAALRLGQSAAAREDPQALLRWVYDRVWKSAPALAGGRVAQVDSVQGIDLGARRITNRTRIPIRLPGQPDALARVTVEVNGSATPEGSNRAAVEFSEFGINGRFWQFPAFLRARSGITTLYVDEALRISQGDQGTLFITARVGDKGEGEEPGSEVGS